MLRRFTYISVATVTLNQRSLLDLLHEARGYNTIDKITGLLIHDNGRFLQVIEGPPVAIAKLVVRLKCDTRHTLLEIHGDVRVDTRLFSDWAMGLGELTDSTFALLPGFVSEADKRDRLDELIERLPELAPALNRAFAGTN
jgi:hypothetical protein